MELGSRQNQMQLASLAAGLPGAGSMYALQAPGQKPVVAVAASALLTKQTSSITAGQSHLRTEEFIKRHGLDEAAAQALRDLPMQAQASIIETELINVRNPSAVVQSRIQAVRSGGAGAASPGAAAGVQPGTVEEYIRRFSLDEKVAYELRMLDPQAQRHVMESDVVNARNPSAVVTSRIQEAKRASTATPFTGFGMSPRQ